MMNTLNEPQLGYGYAQQNMQSQDNGFNARIARLEVRITALEQTRDKQAFDEHAVKSQAAELQAKAHLYAPLRSDTGPLLRLAAFARRLLDPDDLGQAVSQEIRDLAREALGK